jgi:hypothetical protein
MLSVAARRGDAAGRAWRIGLLWGERVRDYGITTTAIARSLASALVARSLLVLLLRVVILFVVCVLELVGCGVGRRLVRWLLAVVCEGGRKWHRRVLGFHWQRIGATAAGCRRSLAAGDGPWRHAKSTRPWACYSRSRDEPQERQDSCYIRLALSRTWEKVLGLASTIARESQGSASSWIRVETAGTANHGWSEWARSSPLTGAAEADKTGYAAPTRL